MTTSQGKIDIQQDEASYQTKEEEKVNSGYSREDTESVSVTSQDRLDALVPSSEDQIAEKAMLECFDQFSSPGRAKERRSIRTKVRESLSKMIDDEDSSDKQLNVAQLNMTNQINEELIVNTNFDEMPFQKHSSILGHLIEKIDNHQQLLNTVALESDEPTDKEQKLNSPESIEKLSVDESYSDENILDKLGELEVDQIDDIVMFADGIASKFAYQTLKKLQGNSGSGKKNKDQKKKNNSLYMKKVQTLQKYIKTAPFTRQKDKATFIFGVLLVIFTSFIIGRYPHTFYYNYYLIVQTMLIFSKCALYKSLGWHYFCTDFCYAANILIFVYIFIFPKSDILFKMCLLYGNGMLGTCIAAFRNQMVFHKYDNLTSLALHAMPLLCVWNIRWSTMPYEATLPESERRFGNLDLSFSFMKFFIYPYAFYLAWAALYFLINFIIKDKQIKDRGYDNCYTHFMSQKWGRMMLHKYGKSEWATKVTFILYHIGCFTIGHFWAIPQMWSEYFNTFSVILWITWSIWNGSSFYMDYFSKKYELSLQKLDMVQKQIEQEQEQDEQLKIEEQKTQPE